MSRSIVVGLGSIGRRHLDILRELGAEAAAISRRPGADFSSVGDAVTAWQPDYAIVATETSDHERVLDELSEAGFTGLVAIEKPLFAEPGAFPWTGFDAYIAYPLRFHPGLVRLKQTLAGETILSAQFYVGQYLPDWRPGQDYRECYSAHAAQGGGALRDLSHELDLANWLLGPWRRLAALGGKLSGLEIDSDDAFAILGEFAGCPAATIHMNYLDRTHRRQVVINTARHTFALDFVGRTLCRDQDEPEIFELDRNTIYRAMHQAALGGDRTALASVKDGLRVMDMIAAAEKAAHAGSWMEAPR